MKSTAQGTFLTVVGFLGMTLLLCVVAIALLAGYDKDVPTILETLAVAALGTIGALLAKTPNDSTPQAVQVINRAANPVKVEQAS